MDMTFLPVPYLSPLSLYDRNQLYVWRVGVYEQLILTKYGLAASTSDVVKDRLFIISWDWVTALHRASPPLNSVLWEVFTIYILNELMTQTANASESNLSCGTVQVWTWGQRCITWLYNFDAWSNPLLFISTYRVPFITSFFISSENISCTSGF